MHCGTEAGCSGVDRECFCTCEVCSPVFDNSIDYDEASEESFEADEV